MNFRTDLALEAAEPIIKDLAGVEYSQTKRGNTNIIEMHVKDDNAAKKIGKPLGTYITVELPPLTDYFKNTDNRIRVIAEEICKMIPKSGPILVAGLGNPNITPDALGPKAVGKVLATRHIKGEIAKSVGLDNLREVCVISPGVLGQTGMEAAEIISSVAKNINASCIIAIDAIASRKISRLGCTVQISDSGISPGSGIGNHRPAINKQSLNVPVIGIGVPTVVDAITLASDIISGSDEELSDSIKESINPRGERMIVTPREIDLLIERAALLIGMSINCALHPDFHPDDLHSLVS